MQTGLFPLFETERLLLRQLSFEDANEIFLLRSDEKHNEFVDRPKATSIEDAKAFIGKIQELLSQGQSYFWAIQLKEEKTLAGTVTLWNLDKEVNKAEMGYELLLRYQGKGIMNEAVTAVLDFGFRTLKLNRIEAWPLPENHKSTALLKKFGFKEDPEAQKRQPADAKEVIYFLTAEDHLYK